MLDARSRIIVSIHTVPPNIECCATNYSHRTQNTQTPMTHVYLKMQATTIAL